PSGLDRPQGHVRTNPQDQGTNRSTPPVPARRVRPRGPMAARGDHGAAGSPSSPCRVRARQRALPLLCHRRLHRSLARPSRAHHPPFAAYAPRVVQRRTAADRSLISQAEGMTRHAVTMPGRSRWFFLATAATAASVVATTLSTTGLAYVNVDSLMRDTGYFYACLLIPVVLVVVAVVLATLPRIAISLPVFLGVLVLSEAGARTPPGP